ncbi:unnamed protein product [Trichobilharzia regenti]|nr:unnamed protein product [Trichobilharzia regenti]
MRNEERNSPVTPVMVCALKEILEKQFNRKNHGIYPLVDKVRLCNSSGDMRELFNKTSAANYFKSTVPLLSIHATANMAQLPSLLSPKEICTVEFTCANITQTIRTLKSPKDFGTDGVSSYFLSIWWP